MRKVKIAVLDTGVDLSHPVFKGKEIPQFVYRDKRLVRAVYDPKQGHGCTLACKAGQICTQSRILEIDIVDIQRTKEPVMAMTITGLLFAIRRFRLALAAYPPR
jgi:hypothetical protein